MDTSRNTPLPVRARPASAAQIAIAATSPPTESETGKPTRSGAVSGVPVMLIIPDEALDDLVVRGRLAHRAGLAEAGDRAVDQSRVGAVQDVPVVADAVQHAGPEVLEQHVRVAHQLLEGRPVAGSLRSSSIDFFPAFWARNEAPMPAWLSAGLRAEPAGQVAVPRLFDLDDLGAEQHQLVAAVRAGQYVGQVEDPYAAQRSVVHALPLGRHWGYARHGRRRSIRGFMSP